MGRWEVVMIIIVISEVRIEEFFKSNFVKIWRLGDILDNKENDVFKFYNLINKFFFKFFIIYF